MFSFLAKNKFGEDVCLKWTVPEHTLQGDGSSCGALVCWYGEMIARGNNITGCVNVAEQRRAIFKKITGDCLSDSNSRSVHRDKNICRECGKADGSEWVECSRCWQWHHCGSVGLTLEEANSMKIFHCP